MVLIDVYKAKRIIDCEYKIAVIPIGSLEYHGEVLPYGTDSIIAEGVTRYCLKQLKDTRKTCIYLYPTIVYGYSPEWNDIPGTVSLSTSVFIEYLGSIISAIDNNLDVDGYIMVNGHGGNYELLNAFARELYVIYGKPFILIDLWRTASKHGLKYCHACSFEAKLYTFIANDKAEGIDDKYCLDEDLRGYYKDYRVGYCGNPEIDVNEYIKRICSLIHNAVEEIIGETKI